MITRIRTAFSPENENLIKEIRAAALAERSAIFRSNPSKLEFDPALTKFLNDFFKSPANKVSDRFRGEIQLSLTTDVSFELQAAFKNDHHLSIGILPFIDRLLKLRAMNSENYTDARIIIKTLYQEISEFAITKLKEGVRLKTDPQPISVAVPTVIRPVIQLSTVAIADKSSTAFDPMAMARLLVKKSG